MRKATRKPPEAKLLPKPFNPTSWEAAQYNKHLRRADPGIQTSPETRARTNDMFDRLPQAMRLTIKNDPHDVGTRDLIRTMYYWCLGNAEHEAWRVLREAQARQAYNAALIAHHFYGQPLPAAIAAEERKRMLAHTHKEALLDLL